MGNHSLRWLLYLVFFAFVSVRGSSEPSAKSFLWEIQGKSNIVYLLGSIHVGIKEMYPLNPVIDQSFKKSDILVLEVNPDELEEKDQEKVFDKHVYYPRGESLKDHVSLKTYRKAKRKFRELGLHLDDLQKYRAWYLTMMLYYRWLKSQGLYQNYGVDIYMMSQSGDKQVLALESYDFHLSFLNSLSDKTLEWNMLYTMKDMDGGARPVEKLLDSWVKGDIKEFERLMMLSFKDRPELTSLYNLMVLERNRQMILKIESYLKSLKTHFVVVGAGHLLGEKGILKELRVKGYKIKRL